jgi:hypothetical protein
VYKFLKIQGTQCTEWVSAASFNISEKFGAYEHVLLIKMLSIDVSW